MCGLPVDLAWHRDRRQPPCDLTRRRARGGGASELFSPAHAWAATGHTPVPFPDPHTAAGARASAVGPVMAAAAAVPATKDDAGMMGVDSLGTASATGGAT